MRTYPKIRLFVEHPFAPGQSLALADKHAHYLLHVMRIKSGDRLALFNRDSGEWLAEVTYHTKKEVGVTIGECLREPKPGPDVWLVFAPIKHERIDYLAQKATELGVSELRPVFTRHTIVSRVNTDRLYANAVEAAEQCERVDVPVVHDAEPLTHLLANWPKTRTLYYGDESGSGDTVRDALGSATPGHWALLIGPEGGFAPDEFSLLRSLPFTKALSLGPRVMRADTAAVAGLACLQAWLGDWQDKPDFRKQDL